MFGPQILPTNLHRWEHTFGTHRWNMVVFDMSLLEPPSADDTRATVQDPFNSIQMFEFVVYFLQPL